MTEHLLQTRLDHIPYPAAPVLDGLPIPAAPVPADQDAIRQALWCLDSAGKRLQGGAPDSTDEVLRLLRAATAHLAQAVTSADVAPAGAE